MLASPERSVSQTVRTEQSRGLSVGEAAQVCEAYFKTIICIFLDGNDNAGLCHSAPFAFLSLGGVNQMWVEVNICFQTNVTWWALLFPNGAPSSAPAFLPFLFSSC